MGCIKIQKLTYDNVPSAGRALLETSERTLCKCHDVRQAGVSWLFVMSVWEGAPSNAVCANLLSPFGRCFRAAAGRRVAARIGRGAMRTHGPPNHGGPLLPLIKPQLYQGLCLLWARACHWMGTRRARGCPRRLLLIVIPPSHHAAQTHFADDR